MKKLLLCLVVITMAGMLLGGCSAKNIEGSLEDIMAQIYDGSGGQYFTMKKAIAPGDTDLFEYYFGTTNIKFTEALASDAAISPGVHSVVLIRVTNDENISALTNRIKDSNIGMKWICAGVPKDEVIVDNIGNLVVIIIEKNPQALYDSFKSLAK